MTMLPPETTPEWTERDEAHLHHVLNPDTPGYVYMPLEKNFAREIRRLRSEREAQDAEIAKLRSELAATLGVPQVEVLIECEKCGRVLDGRVGDSCNRCSGKMQRIVRYLSASVPNTGTALSVREMQAINARRSARWMAGSPGWTTLEIAGELAGEVGELANVCKKLRRSEMGVPGNKVSDEVLFQQARGEMADVMIVLMLTASKLGIDLQDAVCATFNAKSEQMGFPERLSSAPSRGSANAESGVRDGI